MSADEPSDIDQFLAANSPRKTTDKRSNKAALWVNNEGWDEVAIPPRPWIAKGYFLRGALTVVSGPGSAGKSSLVVSWTACLALGEEFHRMRALEARKPLRVMSYNVEDDLNELRRRYSAELRRVARSPQELMRNLTLVGPTGSGALLSLDGGGGYIVNTAAMDILEDEVAVRKPDILFLDPFVELHSADENDNTAVRSVLAKFRAMAVEHSMAVVLMHHTRKGLASPGDPDTMRGASAIAGAARVVLTLNVMTTDEAKGFGLPDDRRRYFARLDGAKMNYSPVGEAEWFERRSVGLDNGPLEDGDGDGVGCLYEWAPPSVVADSGALDKLVGIIARGSVDGPYGERITNHARSVRSAMVLAGIDTPDAQKAALQDLMSAGRVVIADFKRTGKGDVRAGLRTRDGQPSRFHWLEEQEVT